MRISGIRIAGFRSWKNQTIEFSPKLTTIVGETGSGKSTIIHALDPLFAWAANQNVSLQHDYPFGEPGPVSIGVDLRFDANELQDLLIRRLLPEQADPEKARSFTRWLETLGSDVSLTWTSPPSAGVLRWGELFFRGEQVRVRDASPPDRAKGSREGFVDMVVSQQGKDGRLREEASGQHFNLNIEIARGVAQVLAKHVRVLGEFRQRSTSNRSTSMEALSGQETAAVLFNLKNNPDPEEQERYADIQRAMNELLPRFQIEAVEDPVGSGNLDVQFRMKGRRKPVRFDHVSAGMQEVATLLVNVIGRVQLILFVEHPEQHLHPHASRFVMRRLRSAAERNQVVVITHDPQFVDSWDPLGLRRVWWTADSGTLARGPSGALESKVRGQLQTALREAEKREVLFARFVLLVEDETQAGFIQGIAPTLGYDLDAHSVSVVYVGGHDSHRPYRTLVQELGIPYLILRDKPWNNDQQFPPDRFLSLGKEIEHYLDDCGLKDLRLNAERDYGKSKRRVGSVLGASLPIEKIPPFFKKLLKRVVALATGEPEPVGANPHSFEKEAPVPRTT